MVILDSIARSALRVLLAISVFFGILFLAAGISHFQTTGSLFPIHHIESLHAPIPVTGWTPTALLLADGRSLPIPNITNLPATSPALTEFTKRGIEIAPDGHVICLTRIWHWCGNDPVTEDIRRINLTDALRYLNVGDPIVPPPPQDPDLEPGDHSNAISESGWNLSDYNRSRLKPA